MKIIYAFLAAIAVYLLGTFYSAGFDISLWSELTRGLIATGIAGVFVVPFLWVD